MYETTVFTETVIKGSNGQKGRSLLMRNWKTNPTPENHRLVFRLRNWTSQWAICPLPTGVLVDKSWRIVPNSEEYTKLSFLFFFFPATTFILNYKLITPFHDYLHTLAFVYINIINQLYVYIYCLLLIGLYYSQSYTLLPLTTRMSPLLHMAYNFVRYRKTAAV